MLPNEMVLAPLQKLKIKYELSYQSTTRLKYTDTFDQLLIIKSYEVTNMVRSYEKGTKMLRNKLRKALIMKLPSYEIVTPPIGIIYYDV